MKDFGKKTIEVEYTDDWDDDRPVVVPGTGFMPFMMVVVVVLIAILAVACLLVQGMTTAGLH